MNRSSRPRHPAALGDRVGAVIEAFNTSPPRVLTAGVLVTVLFFFCMGWALWSANTALNRIARDDLRIQQLSGKIIHLDEVLTMSARMAAATGDPQWEQRYRTYEPQLGAAIATAISLYPESATGAGALRTNRANKALVALENQAFRLVRQGDAEGAVRLVSNEGYAKQKRAYSAGIALTYRGSSGASTRSSPRKADCSGVFSSLPSRASAFCCWRGSPCSRCFVGISARYAARRTSSITASTTRWRRSSQLPI